MTNSQSLSVIGCISLVSLLVLASEVSAQNHNTTVDTPWVWVDHPSTIVTGDLPLRPGQDSMSWSHDGWISYGRKATPEECKQSCGADKECWAFTWHGGDPVEWSGYCYGRAPNTRRVLPRVFENSNSGDFSAYKSFAGRTFPNTFDYGRGMKQHWLPETSFQQMPRVNLFAGGFCSRTTKDQSIVTGDMYIGDFNVATRSGYVTARTGAVNIGVTFTEAMCSAAANYMIYLDMVAGTPSVLAIYYTWFNDIGSYRLCFIGSKIFGSHEDVNAVSGKRTGIIPDLDVEPEDPID